MTDKSKMTASVAAEEMTKYLRSCLQGLVGKTTDQVLAKLQATEGVVGAKIDPDDPTKILVYPDMPINDIRINFNIEEPEGLIAEREKVRGKYIWLSPFGDLFATEECEPPVPDSQLLTRVTSEEGRYKGSDTYTPTRGDRFEGVG